MGKQKITMTIDEKVFNAFKELCKRRAMKVSSKVELMMREFVEQSDDDTELERTTKRSSRRNTDREDSRETDRGTDSDSDNEGRVGVKRRHTPAGERPLGDENGGAR